MARTPEQFRESGIEVRLNTRVEEVDTSLGRARLADGSSLPYDKLVVATGARAIVPPIPGNDFPGVFTLKNLSDGLRIKKYIREKTCRQALIIGSGFIGMEMCEALKNIGMEVKVLNRGDLPVNRWDPAFSQLVVEEMSRQGVSFITKIQGTAIEQREGNLFLETNQGPFPADLIILAVGIKPQVALAAQMGLELGETGAIRVDFSQRASREEIYAVGDCAEVFHRVSNRWVNIPLGDIANKQGRVAGRNIGGNPMEFRGIVGAQAFKIFNLELAATGLDETEAAAAGFQPVSAIVWGNSLPSAMPGSARIGLKLVADRATGKLLGAQAAGENGAVSRINSLSVALWSGLNLDDVGYLDLAYAPPVGTAWDLLHHGAQSLRKKL
ncbi:MAG: FAD-dependent oxidoreductase [Smithellaceae bacterium]|nr:FAD-dependent oxidoreductase [Smithellaceae bacterium]